MIAVRILPTPRSDLAGWFHVMPEPWKWRRIRELARGRFSAEYIAWLAGRGLDETRRIIGGPP